MVTHLFITLFSAAVSAEGEPSSLALRAAATVPSRVEVGGSGSSAASRPPKRGPSGAKRESLLVSAGDLRAKGRGSAAPDEEGSRASPHRHEPAPRGRSSPEGRAGAFCGESKALPREHSGLAGRREAGVSGPAEGAALAPSRRG